MMPLLDDVATAVSKRGICALNFDMMQDSGIQNLHAIFEIKSYLKVFYIVYLMMWLQSSIIGV